MTPGLECNPWAVYRRSKTAFRLHSAQDLCEAQQIAPVGLGQDPDRRSRSQTRGGFQQWRSTLTSLLIPIEGLADQNRSRLLFSHRLNLLALVTFFRAQAVCAIWPTATPLDGFAPEHHPNRHQQHNKGNDKKCRKKECHSKSPHLKFQRNKASKALTRKRGPQPPFPTTRLAISPRNRPA